MTNSLPGTSLALSLVVSVAFTSVALAGPAVATRWADVKISQDECLKRAEGAVRGAGFGRLERTEQSRYGVLDDYTAAVRCISSNGVVLFIASGPSRARADGLAGALYRNF